MKIFLAVSVALCLVAQVARAADGDVAITSQPKKFASKTTQGQPHSQTGSKTQEWGYSITLENKTFKPFTTLDVKYKIFYHHEQLGVKGPGEKKISDGSFTVDQLPSLGKLSFDTSSVELTTSSLVTPAGYAYSYFSNGAKPKVSDSLTGVWVRIFQNGNLLAEFANPSTLTSREKWE